MYYRARKVAGGIPTQAERAVLSLSPPTHALGAHRGASAKVDRVAGLLIPSVVLYLARTALSLQICPQPWHEVLVSPASRCPSPAPNESASPRDGQRALASCRRTLTLASSAGPAGSSSGH